MSEEVSTIAPSFTLEELQSAIGVLRESDIRFQGTDVRIFSEKFLNQLSEAEERRKKCKSKVEHKESSQDG